MRLALDVASEDAWIIPLDDDDPPSSCRHIESVAEFAVKARERYSNLAAAGIVGGRFNWRSGLISRVPDSDLHGEISVDFLGCGYQPMYAAAALRDVGVFDEKLFFGYTEVEYGLRLRQAGYKVLANGDAWHRLRESQGRLGICVHPSPRCLVTWKKYYSIRNYVYVMKRAGCWYFVAKQALIQCLLKPLYTAFRDRQTAVAGLRLAWTATMDGLTGKMGRRVEPIMTVSQTSLAPNIAATRNVLSAAHSTPK
jgi:GT2 family glycosyltransferase